MKYEFENEIGKRVKLMDDLTRYHPSLVVDSEGTTIGRQGIWSRQQPGRFVTIRFREITLDILWKGLDLIEK